MRDRCPLLATCPDRSDGGLSQLLPGGCERLLRRLPCARRLHPVEERVELAVERIQPGIRSTRQGVEILDRNQHRLRGIVPGDHDGTPLNGDFEHASELALRLAGRDRGRLAHLTPAVSKRRHTVGPRPARPSARRWRSGCGAYCHLPILSILSDLVKTRPRADGGRRWSQRNGCPYGTVKTTLPMCWPSSRTRCASAARSRGNVA